MVGIEKKVVKKSRDTVPLIAGTLNTIGTVPVVNTITKHVKMIRLFLFGGPMKTTETAVG